MLLSRDCINSLADAIRPHITPYIEEHGEITDKEVKELVYRYTGHRVGSERTLQMIHHRLIMGSDEDFD